jgi:hypothetical protein
MRREIGVAHHTNGTTNGADELQLSELIDEGTYGKVFKGMAPVWCFLCTHAWLCCMSVFGMCKRRPQPGKARVQLDGAHHRWIMICAVYRRLHIPVSTTHHHLNVLLLCFVLSQSLPVLLLGWSCRPVARQHSCCQDDGAARQDVWC